MRELWTRPDEKPAVEQVVEQLATARLLTTSVDTSGERQVEVAHEALIRGWPYLRRWIEEDRAALHTHRRITEAAQEWLRMQRDESMLFRGARLAQAKEWRDHHEEDLNALEREFLDASVTRHVREAEAEQERQRRELAQAQALAEEQKHRAEDQARATRRLRRRAVGLVVVVLLAAVAVLYAWTQQQRARTQQERAQIDNYNRDNNIGYLPRVSNPLGASLHLYRVQKTSVEEIKGFDGNDKHLQAGDYYLQAKKENWILKFPIYTRIRARSR
jgi:hypothetical protein